MKLFPKVGTTYKIDMKKWSDLRNHFIKSGTKKHSTFPLLISARQSRLTQVSNCPGSFSSFVGQFRSGLQVDPLRVPLLSQTSSISLMKTETAVKPESKFPPRWSLSGCRSLTRDPGLDQEENLWTTALRAVYTAAVFRAGKH